MRVRPGIKTTSSQPRWALTRSFAELFDPALVSDELAAKIDAWRDAHMSPGGRLKALTAQQRAQRAHAVRVALPDGEVRSLEPGEASVILKGVIELWAPRRLVDPVVLTISEPGDKIYTAEARAASPGRRYQLGDPSPGRSARRHRCRAADVLDRRGRRERRTNRRGSQTRSRAVGWPAHSGGGLSALPHGVRLAQQRPQARRRLKDLAIGTYAWYADEPMCELAWYRVADG